MIVVLAPDVPRPVLDRLAADMTARGWQVDASRGREQTVMLVAGPAHAEDLRSVLAGLEADILPVLDAEQYQHQHRRRRSLSWMIRGLAVLVLTGLMFPAWAYLQPPAEPVVAPVMVHVPGAKDLDVGRSLLLRVDGTPIHVIRVAPAKWHAVSAACTYVSSCLLDWSADEQRLVCTCHGCVFDAYGNVLHPPASVPLVGFSVIESGSELYVRRTIG